LTLESGTHLKPLFFVSETDRETETEETVTKNRGVEWGKNKEYDRQELRRNTAGQFDGDNIVRQTFAANVAFYNVVW